MPALDVTDAPRNVTPTEPRKRRTPDDRAADLRAKADVVLADARAREHARLRKRAETLLERAHSALGQAAIIMSPVDAEKSQALLDLAGQVEGLELE